MSRESKRALRRRLLSLLGIAGLCTAAALTGYWLSARHSSLVPKSPGAVFTLPDTDGRARTSTEWRGKVVLLNFWATWCAPCRDEIPLLAAMQTQYQNRGLQVVGVALDDLQAVRRFSDEVGINYPSLVAPDEGPALIARLGGKGVLPYSVILDRNGAVRDSRHGVYSPAELETAIRAAL